MIIGDLYQFGLRFVRKKIITWVEYNTIILQITHVNIYIKEGTYPS